MLTERPFTVPRANRWYSEIGQPAKRQAIGRRPLDCRRTLVDHKPSTEFDKLSHELADNVAENDGAVSGHVTHHLSVAAASLHRAKTNFLLAASEMG
jgi:hypothetical protein